MKKLKEEDIYKILTVEGSVNSKKTLGGTSHSEVIKQIKKAKKLVSTKRWKNFMMMKWKKIAIQIYGNGKTFHLKKIWKYQ